MADSDLTSSLPTFIVIGATHSGTETLHAWLNDHRDICMSPREGLDFFLEDGTWDKGAGWYALRFGNCRWDQARGESSPRYADTHRDLGVPKRMASVVPDARLIYLLREPMERMRALYRQRAATGEEALSFAEAVTTDPDYLQASRYIEHIGAYLKEFDKKQLLVITSEQLAADPQATLATVHKHLGVFHEPLAEVKMHREVTADQRSDSTLSRRLKANPAYWRALNRSWQLRTWHEKVFTRKSHVASTRLTKEADAELRGQLEKDTQALEVFMGRRLREWGR